MPFINGSVTWLRFKVVGSKPAMFSEEHLERLAKRAAGSSRIATIDGSDQGWTAGDHDFDTDFKLEKNIVAESLQFGFRVDKQKPPPSLLKSYFAIELAALAKNNPSGFASSKQKREAKQAAIDRIEEESKDNRFRKTTVIPIMWDSRTNEVFYGSTSLTNLDRFTSEFHTTFGCSLEPFTAGRLAYRQAEQNDASHAIDNANLSSFTDEPLTEIAWFADESIRDFLGNEFGVWLWHYLEQADDTLEASDGSDITVMISKSVRLECPRNRTGKGAMTHEGPSRMPEAKRCLMAGKLPRKMGLTIVRHDQQYSLSLSLESFAVSSLKLPPPHEGVTNLHAKKQDRVEMIREAVKTIDLLYECFVEKRTSNLWPGVVQDIKNWVMMTKSQYAVASSLRGIDTGIAENYSQNLESARSMADEAKKEGQS